MDPAQQSGESNSTEQSYEGLQSEQSQDVSMQPSLEAGYAENSEGDIPTTGFSRTSSLKKLLLVMVVSSVFLLSVSGVLFILVNNSVKKKANKPVVIPTLAPSRAPTMPAVIPTVIASPSAVLTMSPIVPSSSVSGRLAFIKDGDIYTSDFAKFSIFVKNRIPAGDKLAWSPKGNKLAWRPKTTTATPSGVMVYDRKKGDTTAFTLPDKFNGEVLDFSWSEDENTMAILVKDTSNRVVFSSLNSEAGKKPQTINLSSSTYKQILWSKEQTVLISGDEGISSISEQSGSPSAIIKGKVYWMNFSPDKSKLLYSIGDNKKSDLYLANSDGSENKMIQPVPNAIDMWDTNIAKEKLAGGFIPYAIFFPKGDKLLVGYHYLTGLPLVGVYDLTLNSFKAIAPFIIYPTDAMTDNLRLAGARVSNTGQLPAWNLSIFTLEDDSKLGIIRTIPGGYSPSFYAGE
jgi:hypothetical protein